jgi:hypothetical protein
MGNKMAKNNKGGSRSNFTKKLAFLRMTLMFLNAFIDPNQKHEINFSERL